MSILSFPDSPWAVRARQNLRAALFCVARQPGLPYAAVSRVYYALFQATMAWLLAEGLAPDLHHAAVWRAAESMRQGLGRDLWRLYTWRRRADYATAEISEARGRQLVADHAALCRELGVREA